jgi:hypothetical protein
VVAVEKRSVADGDRWLHGRGDPGGGHDLALLPCTPARSIWPSRSRSGGVRRKPA